MMGLAAAPALLLTDVEVRKDGARVLAVPLLQVRRGETLAIIGPNGAGKSTLLLVLALLMQPSFGVVRFSGEVATAANALRLRRRMAMVFQEPLLLDTSVVENVSVGLKLRGISRDERYNRAAVWLESFGIGALAGRPARRLSGGEAQRVSLARAFALEPDLLFLDEPFSSLDAPARSSIIADLLKAMRATRTTTVLVTHDRDEALTFGDRVGVLIGGELRQVGAPEDVFGAPADVEVAGFVGVETIAPGVVLEQQDGLAKVEVGGCLLEVASLLPAGAPVLLCVRPEDVTLYANISPIAGTPISSARNRLTGRVQSVVPWGAQVRVIVDCGFPLSAAITRRSAAELSIVAGARVAASFKATSAHLLERAESPSLRAGG